MTTKAPRGSKTKTIDGVKYRRCDTCHELKPASQFTHWRDECDPCFDEGKEFAQRKLAEAIQGLLDLGYSMDKITTVMMTGRNIDEL